MALKAFLLSMDKRLLMTVFTQAIITGLLAWLNIWRVISVQIVARDSISDANDSKVLAKT